MPVIRGIVFDLDGTLLDTLSSLAGTFNRTLESFGLPQHPIDAYRYFIGDGLRACVERCLPGDCRDEETIARFTRRQQEDYLASWHTAHPYAGIDRMLDILQQMDVPVAVVSNKPHAFTERCVEHFFPDIFAVVQGHIEPFAHKPDPASTLAVCRRLGLATNEVAFVGDTATDVRTALAAGNLPVGALWGFRDAEELVSAGASLLAPAPEDVPALIPLN